VDRLETSAQRTLAGMAMEVFLLWQALAAGENSRHQGLQDGCHRQGTPIGFQSRMDTNFHECFCASHARPFSRARQVLAMGIALRCAIFLGLFAGIARADLQFPKPVLTDQIYSESGIASRAFEFQVVGEEVTAVKVTPSCGCTVAELPKEVLASGEKGTLSFRYNPEGRQGMQAVFLDVEAETGGKKATTRLTYRVNVLQAVVLQPEIVFWKKEEPAAAKEVLVRADDSLTPKSFQIEKSPRNFVTELRWDKERGFHILKITPKEPMQPIKEPIRIVMEDASGRKFERTLFALIR
jgi:hypothetical protein